MVTNNYPSIITVDSGTKVERMTVSNHPKTIAVDFDGCLHSGKWPEIGKPNWQAINELLRRKAIGDKVILWSCREGDLLEDAVLWCLNHGLKFDAVNDNLPEHIAHFGGRCRKVYANEYWDDKAVPVIAGQTKITQGPEGYVVVIHEAQRKSVFRKIADWISK